MTKHAAALARKLSPRAARLLASCLILLLLPAAAAAQTGSTWSATDGTTPTSHAPGAPAGSYALSGFESVNLYNGNLNFSLPLLRVGGRGTAAHTITLPLEIRWQETHVIYPTGCNQSGCSGTEENIYPTPNGWKTQPRYAPGVLSIRQAREGEVVHRNEYGHEICRYYQTTLARLTFSAADGTEYELRDDLNEGRPLTHQHCNDGSSYARGRVFKTADGSAATFYADGNIYDLGVQNLTGQLMLRDGTRYGIRGDGAVLWVRDRNGNKVSFAYDASNRVSAITDSLGRQIAITYAAPTRPYDEIAYAGFGGAPRAIRVYYDHLLNALAPGWQIQTFQALFPGLDGSSTTTFNPANTVTAVVLPDNRQYGFKYNSYGELSRVDLPTGGRYEYEYVSAAGGALTQGVNHRVSQRRVYRDAGPTPESTTHYNAAYVSSSPYPYTTVVTVQALNAGGVAQGLSKHYFHGWPGSDAVLNNHPTAYSSWIDGREYKTEALDPANPGAVLRRVEQGWQQRAVVSWWNSNNGPGPANDPRVVETKTTVEPAGPNLVTKQSAIHPTTGAAGFDQYNNPTDAWEYDYGVGTPGALLRHTHTDYKTDSAYTSHTGAHLRSLPAAQQVYGVVAGAETLVAKSETHYDQYNLAGYTSVTGWENPQTTARGNPTTQRRWLDTANAWIETRASYDQVGNVVSATDALNNTSTISYTDSFHNELGHNTYAFPTQNTSPIPDPSNQRATNSPLVTSAVYDYWTGLVRSSTDANGQMTYIQYNDPLDRLTRVDRPDGGWTVYWYGRNAYGDYVGTCTAINASQNTEGYQFSDGLGRPVRSFQHDGAQWITSDTQYDALGRAWRVSANPYLSGGSGTPINPSGHWVETTFDALGRPTHVRTTAENAQVVTAYSGNTVTVTDQAGKSKRSVSDALGRLTRVVEDPFGLGYQTDYSYDALGNLRKVNQGGQLRYFMYDSLSRLVRARNPEQSVNAALALTETFKAPDDQLPNGQWTLGYSYDANSNLYQRTDARNVTTTYQYDNLNRVKQTSYTDTTPLTLFTYDFATNGRGRFHANYESSTSGTINYVFAYDAAGRPTSRRTDFYLNGAGWVGFYPASREYDKAGNVTKQTYPSGRAVDYQQFDVAGRLKVVTGNLGGTARTYATGRNLVTGAEEGIQYDPAGRILEEKYGTQTPLYHKRHYNARGQLYDVRLSSVPWHQDQLDWNRGALLNYYTQQGGWTPGASGTDNSGNVLLAQHWVPDGQGGYNWMNQYYEYDPLNRITHVREQQNGTGAYTAKQQYAYDRWGNRTLDAAGTWLGQPSNPPSPLVNETQFGLEEAASRNRLLAPGDAGQAAEADRKMRYDEAGNLIKDAYTGWGTRAYDAENRMTSAWGYSALAGGPFENKYTYDASGKRVRRKTDAGEVWQVYGFDGELLAEYAAAGTPTQPQKEYGYRAGQLLVVAESNGQARWLVPDHLGTPRMTADQTGSLTGVRRHDYLPFGEEVGVGVGGRTTAQGYTGDSVKNKFTGYERDSETGLDYAQARYYASVPGRFMSPDEFSGGPEDLFAFAAKTATNPTFYADLTNPQSLNKYQYCVNNPLRHVDPDGHRIRLANASASDRREVKARLLYNLAKNERKYFEIRHDRKSGAYTLELKGNVDRALSQPHTKALEYMVQTVRDSDTVRVAISETFQNKGGEQKTADFGGGVTVTHKRSLSGDVEVYLSRGQPPAVLGESGQLIEMPRSIGAGHEVLGHARAILLDPENPDSYDIYHTGNTIDVENELRDGRGLPRRAKPQ